MGPRWIDVTLLAAAFLATPPAVRANHMVYFYTEPHTYARRLLEERTMVTVDKTVPAEYTPLLDDKGDVVKRRLTYSTLEGLRVTVTYDADETIPEGMPDKLYVLRQQDPFEN